MYKACDPNRAGSSLLVSARPILENTSRSSIEGPRTGDGLFLNSRREFARAGEPSARLSHGIFAAIGQFQLLQRPWRAAIRRGLRRHDHTAALSTTTLSRSAGARSQSAAQFGHQPSTLLHHIAASISTFDLAPDGVGKRHFAKLARIRGLLRRPIAERRSEAVDGRAHAAHSAHELQRAHSREGPTRPCAKHEAASARHI